MHRPLFIVGAPRSGTTLLQYMLRAHPGLSIPTGESHFIVPLMRDEAAYGDLSQRENVVAVLQAMHRQRAEFVDTDLHGLRFDVQALADRFVAEGRRTMRELVAGLFEANARGEGKPRWGDKTPYYVLQMPALLGWWPQAQFIHVVRDGRDVALSLMGRRDDFYVYNTYFAARYWEQYVEAGRTHGEALPPRQYLELRYEELLQAPRQALGAVCDFLGLEFQDSVLDYRRPAGGGKTPLLQGPLQTANAGKWRHEMSPSQVRVFERAAGATLERFGYPVSTPGPRLPLPVRAAYRWHNGMVARWRQWRPADEVSRSS
ncbi:sulfotransferase family protein [Rubrivivax gelatinosus]|uniref:sulfotransferase family protein n=1 Tax=Rubrivivax gelatinosus TaxID=28068 RepID=UPI00190900D2|nr:sulfotransferase [Rubrivivax gelatinosus]